jgi:hypothetical protein
VTYSDVLRDRAVTHPRRLGVLQGGLHRRIFDLWLACHSQEEIAEAVGVTHQAVALVLQESATLPEIAKPAAAHLTDFEVPLYNVWKRKRGGPAGELAR